MSMFENKPNQSNGLQNGPSNVTETSAALSSTNGPSGLTRGFRSLVAASLLVANLDQVNAQAPAPGSTNTPPPVPGMTTPPPVAPGTTNTLPPVPGMKTPPGPVVNTDVPKPPPAAPGGTNAPAVSPGATNTPPTTPSATTTPAATPTIFATVVDLSTHKVSGQVYDNFGTKKDIGRATTGQFRQAPAGVLQMVGIGLDQVGRANIPADVVGVIKITASGKTREYEFNPANVPAQDAINPSVFRETVKNDPGLDRLWRSISTANDGIQVELMVMRNNPNTGKKEDGAIFHLYKTGARADEDAKVELSFKKKEK